MKAVRIVSLGLLIGQCAFAQEVPVENVPDTSDMQAQKFFWCKEGVPVALVKEILRLVNTCLEQRIAHDTFVEILGKLLEHINKISIDMEEKARLQKNIQYLINTLKTQSKSESRELKTMIKAVSNL